MTVTWHTSADAYQVLSKRVRPSNLRNQHSGANKRTAFACEVVGTVRWGEGAVVQGAW